MPNCDFYGTPRDHVTVLNGLFSERTCHVYELGSEFEKPLRRFESCEEVMSLFEEQCSVLLQLYVLGAGPEFIPRRVTLDPAFCDGARYRFAAEGWGLVQLYLESPRNNELRNSHTNHNSQKRAETWATTRDSLGDPSAWDFKRINAFSSRLNRQINKSAVAKIASRSVLPGAFELWNSGVSLLPYRRGEHDEYFKELA